MPEFFAHSFEEFGNITNRRWRARQQRGRAAPHRTFEDRFGREASRAEMRQELRDGGRHRAHLPVMKLVIVVGGVHRGRSRSLKKKVFGGNFAPGFSV